MTQLEKVNKTVEIIDSKKAGNIVALDLCGATIIADYFVICTANSAPQMNALFEAACEEMAKAGCVPTVADGKKNPDWALVDFGGVMLHIFSTKARDFYGLDNLWAEAVKLDIKTNPN
ncbi:MAG: ribosome silencing factor [Clostridia bacterium]|nr:ribosome silencing factor [Clostridia bacterium]